MAPEWRKVNLVCSLDGDGRATWSSKPVPVMRPELLGPVRATELAKYMTDEELADSTRCRAGEN